MNQSNARNLQVGTLLDMLAFLKGERTLYKETKDGLETPATFGDADFVVPKDQKLVKENGEYYLLQANQSLNDMTDDEKSDAKNLFLKLKPELMGVKKLVRHNQKLEQQDFQTNKTSLSAQSERMQQEILLLANQLTQMQAARANAQSQLTKHQSSVPGLQMTPMPSTPSLTYRPSSGHQAAKSHQSLAASYVHMVKLMEKNPTKQSIQWLRSSLKNDQDPDLLKQLNLLKPGIPISPIMMQRLLARKSNGSLWKMFDTITPEETETPSVTPFRTTPYPRPGG